MQENWGRDVRGFDFKIYWLIFEILHLHLVYAAAAAAVKLARPTGLTSICCNDPTPSPLTNHLQGVLRERPSHATDLVQCCKTRSDGVDDLGPHGDASVDVDTKVPGCSDWWHQGVTDAKREPVGIWCWRRDDAHQRTSVLAGFSCSRFVFIGHTRRNLVNADRHLLYKTASVRRLTVTVNLGVVCNLHSHEAWDDDV